MFVLLGKRGAVRNCLIDQKIREQEDALRAKYVIDNTFKKEYSEPEGTILKPLFPLLSYVFSFSQ